MIFKRPSPSVALVAALAMAGCSTGGAPGSAPLATATNPLEQYSIPVVETPDQLRLAVHSSGLSFHQREALGGFVSRWREGGSDTVTVQAPTDGPDAPQARDAAIQAMDALMALGVPSGRLRLVGYVAGRPGAPILASFERLQAEAPDCSKEWDNLVATKDNRSYRNFGCSVSSNAAVQVANARDLVEPAAAGASDAMRREVVMGKYREGRNTSSDKDSQARGVVSGAVGNN